MEILDPAPGPENVRRVATTIRSFGLYSTEAVGYDGSGAVAERTLTDLVSQAIDG